MPELSAAARNQRAKHLNAATAPEPLATGTRVRINGRTKYQRVSDLPGPAWRSTDNTKWKSGLVYSWSEIALPGNSLEVLDA